MSLGLIVADTAVPAIIQVRVQSSAQGNQLPAQFRDRTSESAGGGGPV